MRHKNNSRAGVTLIELLVVIVIIAAFGAVAVIKFWPFADKGKITAAQSQVSILSEALQTYHLANGRFPTQEEGLGALRPILQKELGNDPWGNPYVYKYPGDHGDDPDVLSYGADGKPGGTGNDADIVSWK
jgi:general secretion pathway protein G